MAAMDFPPNPTQGQVYSNGTVSYTYNGYAWVGGSPGSSLFAPLLSPVFTGDPRAPTPPVGDNDTSIATTAFVTANAVLKGGDIMTGQLTIWAPTYVPSLRLHETTTGGEKTIRMGAGNNLEIVNAASNAVIHAINDVGDTDFKNGNLNTSGRLRLARAGLGVLPPAYPGAIMITTLTTGEHGITLRPGTDAGYNAMVYENYNTTLIGQIYCSQTNTSYTTTSDARLKEDLQSFDAGHIVDGTEVYDFRWKETGERSYGVIAQQAVEVYAQPIIHDEDNDTWGVDYSKYVPVLLQELKALRARVAELEGQTSIDPKTLDARLEVLEQALARAQRR